MDALKMSTIVGESEVAVELPFGERDVRVHVTLPGGVRVSRSIDVGPWLVVGVSANDVLAFTLKTVAVGVESGSLQVL